MRTIDSRQTWYRDRRNRFLRIRRRRRSETFQQRWCRLQIDCIQRCLASTRLYLTNTTTMTHVILKHRLHDTTYCQTGCNRVNVCIHGTTGCQTRCQTSCQSGLTTGCIVYTNIQPVVKPVWQPVWQTAVSCIQPVVKPRCTTGLTTVLNEQWLFIQHGCQTGCQTRLTTRLTTGCIV